VARRLDPVLRHALVSRAALAVHPSRLASGPGDSRCGPAADRPPDRRQLCGLDASAEATGRERSDDNDPRRGTDMNDSALYITLGHNSSAVFARDGVVVRGYEQERIDRKKSSSAYPREAIELCLGGEASRVGVACVSHWFDDLTLRSNKYLDLEHLRSVANCVVS